MFNSQKGRMPAIEKKEQQVVREQKELFGMICAGRHVADGSWSCGGAVEST